MMILYAFFHFLYTLLSVIFQMIAMKLLNTAFINTADARHIFIEQNVIGPPVYNDYLFIHDLLFIDHFIVSSDMRRC